MIPLLCINDNGRPHEIPEHRWPKAGEWYKATHVYRMLNQNEILGVSLYELPLNESNAPYEAFRLSRFGIKPEDIEAFHTLARDRNELSDLDISEIKELLEEQCEVL